MKAEVGSRDDGSRFLNDVRGARFSDVPTAAHTQVTLANGTGLPANRVQIGGQNVCIASQYPTAAIMESYLSMLAENRTPVLLILASDADIDRGKMPRYFSESGQYGNVSVTVTDQGSRKLADMLDVRDYRMEVTDNSAGKGVRISIPVLHVPNWADHSGQSADVLDALATDVDRIKDQQIDRYKLAKSSALTDPNKLLMAAHCVAGAGRTGQFVAADALQKARAAQKTHLQSPDKVQEDGLKTLERIITDMRESRNHLMVQTEAQLAPLMDLATRQSRSVA